MQKIDVLLLNWCRFVSFSVMNVRVRYRDILCAVTCGIYLL